MTAQRQLARDVWRLGQIPGPFVNVYRAGDLLIDAGGKTDRRRIDKQLDGVELSMLALTHVHPDHQGAARHICETRDIPLACHVDDVAAMEGRAPMQPPGHGNRINGLMIKLFAGPPHPVSRSFEDGDQVGEFRVVHTPGHSPGHTVFFRESDRVAICGDVVRNMSYLTARAGLYEPPDVFTPDPVENRRSIRKLADLEPSLILPGHGPAITDMKAFQSFAAALPA